jgi:hypothetical protein
MFKIGQVVKGWTILDYSHKTDDYTIEKDGKRLIVLASFLNEFQ